MKNGEISKESVGYLCNKDKSIKKEDLQNVDLISKKLKLGKKIKSFTEKNLYYWEGEPKVFAPIENLNLTKPTVVELFSGLGGTSLGFEMAGFQTVLGADIHSPSIETFRHSHPAAIAILGDITKIVKIDEDNSNNILVSEIKNRLKDKHPNVLIAGIPCQGFSLANKKRNFLDARNYLFLYFVEATKSLKPDVIMIENVSGLATLKNGQFVKDITKALNDIGYKVHYKMLNAADYGVPEKRVRIIFLGAKEKIPFPEQIFKENRYRTVDDAISDLPHLENGETCTKYTENCKTEYQRIMRGNCDTLKNHEAPLHLPKVLEKIKNTKPGEPMYSAYKQRIRLNWDRPSPTQVSGGIRPQFQFGHPQDIRGLTIRERCRIQSIPDNVEIFGGLVQGRVQTGNAVPPLLAKSIADEILKYLKKCQLIT